MTTEAEFLNAYEDIQVANRKALKQVELAIELEEQENAEQAIAAYEVSLQYIEEIFAIPVGLPDDFNNVETEWNDACRLIQKLKGAKTEVLYRLKVLKSQNSAIDNEAQEAVEETDGHTEDGSGEPKAKKKPVLLENPATYYDIQQTTQSGIPNGQPKTYKQIIKGLRAIMANREVHVIFDTLFQAQVKLYKIQPNGVVQTLAGETQMSLVMCTVGAEWSYLNGMYFIQCTIKTNEPSTSHQNSNMIWIYPLIPTISNCYRTEFGAFILPDLEADQIGSAFGIILCKPEQLTDEQFVDFQQFFLDLLEAVLAGTVEQLQQPQEGQRVCRDTSEQFSKNMVSAADCIARNLIKGAEKTGELMKKSTPYIMSKMKPAPENPKPISPAVQTTVVVAKGVTNAAVGVTGWVASKVGSASMALGRFLAPHVQHHGANLLQKTCGMDSQEANSKMEGALTLAAGAVEGFSTIVDGLEKSAAILGTNLGENSVKIIDYKYGSSAGNVAAETFDTIGNAFVVSRNVNYMLPKGIAKKMMKNTGKAVFADYKPNNRKESQYIAAGSLYPDLRALKEKSQQKH